MREKYNYYWAKICSDKRIRVDRRYSVIQKITRGRCIYWSIFGSDETYNELPEGWEIVEEIFFPNDGEHKTERIVIGDELIDIDKGILALIKEMNRIGLKTEFCCEDIPYKNGESGSYVVINTDNMNFTYRPQCNQLCLYWNRNMMSKNKPCNIYLENGITKYITKKLWNRWKINDRNKNENKS